MKKKFLLAYVVVTLCILAFGVITASAETIGNLTIGINEEKGYAHVYSCDTSASGSLVIPDTVNGYPVTKIDSGAFEHCRKLTSITIPNSVTEIGYRAFKYCSSLKTIKLPSGLTCINPATFYECQSLTSIIIPNGVTEIGNEAFRFCYDLASVTLPDSLTYIGVDAFGGAKQLWSITIPESVTSIGGYAFSWCEMLREVNITDINSWCEIDFENSYSNPLSNGANLYINGNLVKDLVIPDTVSSISKYAFNYCTSIKSITIPNSVTAIDECSFKGCGITDLYYNGTRDEWIYATNGQDVGITDEIIHFFYYVRLVDEENNENTLKVPVNIAVDFRSVAKTGYSIEAYTDENYENKFDVETPITENTELYIRYTPNKYTYKFVDKDGTVLNEQTADYGSIIELPVFPADKGPYTFDYWEGYTEGMTLSGDITFTAVYKYKDYSITAEGLSEPVTVTYNDSFTIAPQTKDDYHYFIGYFTEKDGEGVQVTNENGESLKPYDTVGDLTVYPYFYEGYMNKIKLQGTPSAMPGDTITVSPIFATDKDVMFLTLTIKYSRVLNYKSINNIDFEEVSIDSEKAVGDYKYIDITCIYDYEGNYIDKKMDFTPFDMEFEVLSNAPLGNSEITIENVVLVGDDNYDITDITNYTCEIVGKLAESIEIIGENTIDKATQFSAVVSPDYTTHKSSHMFMAVVRCFDRAVSDRP